jgi:hypothetical protein
MCLLQTAWGIEENINFYGKLNVFQLFSRQSVTNKLSAKICSFEIICYIGL